MSVSLELSCHLQDVASEIADRLQGIAGQPIGFVLVLNADDVSQYVSNLTRADGVALIEALLTRWKANRADIPAHYNPDLKG